MVKMCDRKLVIEDTDMGDEMQQDAVDCATHALKKFKNEKLIAAVTVIIIIGGIMWCAQGEAQGEAGDRGMENVRVKQ